MNDPNLEDLFHIAGPVRVGEDQQRHGVAIWKAPDKRMGSFQIYVEGLSGETAEVKGEDGKPVQNAEGRPRCCARASKSTSRCTATRFRRRTTPSGRRAKAG